MMPEIGNGLLCLALGIALLLSVYPPLFTHVGRARNRSFRSKLPDNRFDCCQQP